uniref:DegV family protein n=1 Tax=Nocardia carnea TaxID=37328 RepID=UPI0024558115
MAVVIVTDSSASLPADLVGELGIDIVPLHVLVGDTTIREGVDDLDIDYTADAVSTSAPSPGELRDAYTAALARSGGDGVVAVHLSRQLSATWESGRQAVRDMGAEESVRLVDSLGAGLATGLPALAAARSAAAGASLDAVLSAAVTAAESSPTLIQVNSTGQLPRGGRRSTAGGVFGSELVRK